MRTEEQKAKQRAYDKKRLANLTPEQKQRRKEADIACKKRRVITEEIRKRRVAATLRCLAKKKQKMTVAELAALQAKKRAYMQSYVLTPAQKKRVAETGSAWTKKNRDRVNAVRKAWAERHPDSFRIYAQNRRAKKRKQSGTVSADIVDRLLKLQKGKCAGCSERLRDDVELDHVVSLKAGGAHDDSNLQLLCRTCNRIKGTKDPVLFMQSIGFLL